MRRTLWIAALLLATGMAGCAEDGPEGVEARPFPLDVYRFTWTGADTWVPGTEHGWLVRVSNPTHEAVQASLVPVGVQEALLGPVAVGKDGGRDAWLPTRLEGGATTAAPPLWLDAGASGLFLVKVAAYAGDGPVAATGFRVLATLADDPTVPFGTYQTSWNVTLAADAAPVRAGDQVQTVTVGVWVNGTSFYTNSADLFADAAFPHGFPDTDFDATPLPVYVYDKTRDEQPEGSRDTCHFTTINGYNALLKEQAVGSTGVRFLSPETAYTLDGYEDHPLYGDAMVFLDQVVAHDGATTATDAAPNPTGACFADRLDDLPIP